MKPTEIKLLVTDIDNTVFDWVSYYVNSFTIMLKKLEEEIKIPYATMAFEAKSVFEEHGSIEYPFLIQELPSVIEYFDSDIDHMLRVVAKCRDAFINQTDQHLKTYDGVGETLAEIKRRHPDLPIVALTDAPRYVAMWKMNKLNLLQYFDAIYGLQDPRVPVDGKQNRVKVDPELLMKHLQKYSFGFKGSIRILPDEYEKPGIRGLKTVLMDYDLDETAEQKASVVWVGDNLNKDVSLGKRLGVKSVWAKYGADVNKELLDALAEFSPESSIHKNVPIVTGTPAEKKKKEPDAVLECFSDLLKSF